MTIGDVDTARPRRRPDLAERDVDGTRLVYGAHGQPHALDPLGAALFDTLDGEATVRELTEDLAAAVEQPYEAAAASLGAFLGDLEARGLLAGSAPPATEAGGHRHPLVPPSP